MVSFWRRDVCVWRERLREVYLRNNFFNYIFEGIIRYKLHGDTNKRTWGHIHGLGEMKNIFKMFLFFFINNNKLRLLNG